MDNTQQLLACLKPVKSSMFSKAGYSEDFWTLVLAFKSSKEIKAYKNCAPEVADEALSDKSLGGWWNKHIKGNPAWDAEVIGVDEPAAPVEKPKPQVQGGITDADIRAAEPGWDGEKIVRLTNVAQVQSGKFVNGELVPFGLEDTFNGPVTVSAPKQMSTSEVADWPQNFGVKEYDPQTGHWPTDAVNEDGTIKEEAIAAAMTKQTSGEILGAWTAPESAAEALDLLSEREGEIRAIIAANAETGQQALTVKITDADTRLKASETLDRLVSKKDKTVAALDPFRKVLYEAYGECQQKLKAGVDPLEGGIKHVKNAIITWDQAQERERQRLIREDNERREKEARRLQEEEAERIRLADVQDKLDEGDDHGAQLLFDAPVAPVPRPYIAPTYLPPAAPKVEGQSTSNKWKVDEDAIEDDQAYLASIITLIRAVQAGKYDIQQAAALLQWDLPAVNKLAGALGSAFAVPGLSVKEAGSLSVRRKKK